MGSVIIAAAISSIDVDIRGWVTSSVVRSLWNCESMASANASALSLLV